MAVQNVAGVSVWLGIVLLPMAGTGLPAASYVTTGGVEGTVSDEAGQQLAGVFVLALPERGGTTIRATTDSGGAYHLTGLSDEPYRLDFWLQGFQGVRHNHVHPGLEVRTRIDAVLLVRPQCECVRSGPSPTSRKIAGQVVDDGGRPLPHAVVEFAGPVRREKAWADEERQFKVSPPADGSWSLVASDGAFASESRTVSAKTTGPLTFRLRFVGSEQLPPTERFHSGCACPEYLSEVRREERD